MNASYQHALKLTAMNSYKINILSPVQVWSSQTENRFKLAANLSAIR